MERVGRPGDEIRERLTEQDIGRLCKAHGLPRPERITPERRGNECVCYHLDDALFLAFVIDEDVRQKAEALQLLEGIEEIPTPRVLAWSEADTVLDLPYMLVERCPGDRLDRLWKTVGAERRVDLLEALGSGTGRYHTVTADALMARASQLGLDHRVRHLEEPAEGEGPDLTGALPTLAARLCRIGVEADSLVDRLESHLLRVGDRLEALTPPGLVHIEPCAEHYILQETAGGFRLSGCVDLGLGVGGADGEIVSHYVSMLGLDRRCLDAFWRGYERFYPLPDDLEERLNAAAVRHDLVNILWLLDSVETRPGWAFAKGWIEGQFPNRGPLKVEELYRREYWSYTEVKLLYDGEPGERIPAYLLLPRRAPEGRIPAVLAPHQCAWQCDIGKEQVVGKCVDLADQAYGLELVREGFALVRQIEEKDGERTFSMAEYFVLRKYRRKGVGTSAARQVFDRAPGRWSVGQEEANRPAQAFWKKVIGDYTGGTFSTRRDEKGPVLAFETAGRRER